MDKLESASDGVTAMPEVLRTETATTRTELGELPLLIPVPRAAKLLGISRSAAYRCAASGDLPSTHLGGRVYVVTRRLQELLESA